MGATGTSQSNGLDIVLLKYAPDIGSDPIWSMQYDGPGHGNDEAAGILIDSSGYVYACGTSPGDGTGKAFCEKCPLVFWPTYEPVLPQMVTVDRRRQ